jgi:hypothetical protein
LRQSPRKYPVHTSEDLVMNGTWKIVGHDANLLRCSRPSPLSITGRMRGLASTRASSAPRKRLTAR